MSRLVIASGVFGSLSALKSLIEVATSRDSKLILLGGYFGFSFHDSFISVVRDSSALTLSSQSDLYVAHPEENKWLGSAEIRKSLDYARSLTPSPDLNWVDGLSESANFEGRLFCSNAADENFSFSISPPIFGRPPNNGSTLPGWDGPCMWDESERISPLAIGCHNLKSVRPKYLLPSRVVLQGQLGRGYYLYVEDDWVESCSIHFDPQDILEWLSKVPKLRESYWQMLVTSAARVRREIVGQ